ncbi:MAG: tryptophanase, partial [bacterium]|nr:tryptophanase [bacterium]
MDFPAEPFKIKVIEPISITTEEERKKIIEDAHFNIFNVPSDKIYIDLLTDSGTSAMSDNQWSGIMIGDESYAGSKSYFKFEKVIRSIFGYKHIIPTHQGRVAENLLFSSVLKADSVVPNNIHFDTTRGNIEHNNAKAVDLVIDEGLDPHKEHPFKGNIDIEKLENLIEDVGVERIPLVLITITNNSGGGQPVSMENIRQASAVCKKYDIPLIFDACRFAENCFFIKQREKGYENKSVLEIARELFSYGNGCTMSAKKDALVNIGGFLCLEDDDLAQRITNLLIMIEGFPTYGGMAGRDLEAVARGLEEVLDENYLNFRISQVRYLGEKLQEGGVPILIPVGGHAVYVNAKEFVPHIPQPQFPGVALTVALYKKGGIRAAEIGSLMFASKDPETGEPVYPELEMVRLAIPRRVYTVKHMDYVAATLIDIYKNRDRIRGLELVYEAPSLRHFTAKLKE